MKRLVITIAFAGAVASAWLLWDRPRDRTTGPPRGAAPPVRSDRRDPKPVPGSQDAAITLTVLLAARANVPEPVRVELWTSDPSLTAPRLVEERMTTIVESQVEFEVATAALAIVVVRTADAGVPVACRRVPSHIDEVVIELPRLVDVFVLVEPGWCAGEADVRLRFDARGSAEKTFGITRRLVVRPGTPALAGRFPPGIVRLAALRGGRYAERNAEVDGASEIVVFRAPRQGPLVVDVKTQQRRAFRVIASSRSRQRALDNAIGRSSAEPPGEIVSASLYGAGRVEFQGLESESFRVTVIDVESEPVRVVWQREDVRAGGVIEADLEVRDPEGRVARGESFVLVDQTGAPFTGAGALAWEVYVDGYVVEGRLKWPGNTVLPPVTGVAEVTFVPVPSAEFGRDIGIARWTFWTVGASVAPARKLELPRGRRLAVSSPMQGALEILVVDSGSRPIRVGAEHLVSLVEKTETGWYLLGIPEGARAFVVRDDVAEAISGDDVQVAARNSSPIPRAVLVETEVDQKRVGPIVVPASGAKTITLPALPSVVVELVPDLSEASLRAREALSTPFVGPDIVLD